MPDKECSRLACESGRPADWQLGIDVWPSPALYPNDDPFRTRLGIHVCDPCTAHVTVEEFLEDGAFQQIVDRAAMVMGRVPPDWATAKLHLYPPSEWVTADDAPHPD